MYFNHFNYYQFFKQVVVMIDSHTSTAVLYNIDCNLMYYTDIHGYKSNNIQCFLIDHVSLHS